LEFAVTVTGPLLGAILFIATCTNDATFPAAREIAPAFSAFGTYKIAQVFLPLAIGTYVTDIAITITFGIELREFANMAFR
jgi:hypothetical protein